MSLILGIDPGSRITGYGIIKTQGSQLKYVTSGLIRTQPKSDFHSRLYQIFEGIQTLVQEYHPDEAAIEQIFAARNPSSALKLGQARGAAVTAVASYSLPISEYTPRSVKLAITGYGGAEKQQIQEMIARLLKLNDLPKEDAADALAIAICHANTSLYSKAV